MQIPSIDPLHFMGGVELKHLGMMECQGADACHFLHQQLTQEMMSLPPGQSTKAGFCNAKGRLQASMVVMKVSNELLYLVLRRDLLERTLKRLSMFVLRAKVKLKDVSEDHALMGVVGESAQVQATLHAQPSLQAPLQSCLGRSRTLLAIPKGSMGEEMAAQKGVAPLSQEDWLTTEILSAEAWVEDKTFEHFVPQMLNFESTGAVSFKKGCYPGQEVVARSQFRGTLKKRTVIVFSNEALQVGMEIFSALHASEPCAEVLQVSRFGELHWALACFQIESLMKSVAPEAADQGFNDFVKKAPYWTHCFSTQPQAKQAMNLGFWPLPYTLLEDI
jgi:tRNA-modifying protein YgfZ